MELKVARLASFVQKWDPMDLRNLIPYWVKQLIFILISHWRKAGKPESSTATFSVDKEDRNGLDLLAVCTKE
jgi:hypothetical protein